MCSLLCKGVTELEKFPGNIAQEQGKTPGQLLRKPIRNTHTASYSADRSNVRRSSFQRKWILSENRSINQRRVRLRDN